METLQRTANRGSISTDTGFNIDNSCKFEKGNSETMYRQQVNGDRRTWTSSFWIKFCGGTGSGTDTHMLYHGVYGQGTRLFTSGGTDQLYIDLCSTGDERYRWITERVFRDRSAWYHIVWRVDTTQSSLSDRMRLYVNGEQITDWQKEADDADSDSSNSGNKMPQNYQTLANYDHGGYDKMQFSYKEASIYADMYIAEFHHCDGYSYAPTEFGESDSDTGIWKPIEPSVSYGNSGCHLDFKDSSNMGNDANGGTDFTLQNISAADQATDTPTNNFCTMNPLWAASYITYTEGATNVDTTGGGWMSMVSTFAVSKGKWYWEFKRDSGNAFVGIVDAEDDDIPRSTAGYFFGYNDDSSTNSLGMYSVNGQVYNSPGGTPDGATYTTSQIVGVAVDMDNYKLYYHVNGTYAGSMDPAAGSGGVTIPTTWTSDSVYMGFSGFNGSYAVNFGGYTTISISSAADDGDYGTFEYAPPSGYYALCTKRLAEYG